MWTVFLASLKTLLPLERMKIKFKKLHPLAVTPEYKTAGAAAFDIGLIEDIKISPRSFLKVRTGLVIATPENHVLILASRSSNPVKKGIDFANSIGVIDSDYCGPNDELFLILENITDEIVELRAGDRVAQGMFIPVTRGEFEEMDIIESTDRGGHGSTGN